MTNEPKYYLLKKNLFLFGLALLILNDFYLKYAFSNFLTGKLSDFVGLFIFPYFISIFFEKNVKKIYFITALFFTFWKFEISQPFIDWISSFSNIAFYRTVDKTDLIALIVLPFSYQYFKRKLIEKENPKIILDSLIGILSMFIFVADSNPRETINLKIQSNKKYEISLSKDAIFKKSDFRHSYEENRNEKSFSFCYDLPEYNAKITAKTTVNEVSKNLTIVQLDSITEIEVMGKLFVGIKQSDIDNCKKLKPEELEKYFELNCINYLNSVLDEFERPYYVYSTNEFK
jgi:hypothetical protein